LPDAGASEAAGKMNQSRFNKNLRTWLWGGKNGWHGRIYQLTVFLNFSNDGLAVLTPSWNRQLHSRPCQPTHTRPVLKTVKRDSENISSACAGVCRRVSVSVNRVFWHDQVSDLRQPNDYYPPGLGVAGLEIKPTLKTR
jgi:hypothetical protein